MQTLSNTPADRLAEELQAAATLIKLLEQEQACLVEANVDDLTRLAEEKAGTVTLMTELALHRNRKLAAAGLPATDTGMRAWLQSPSATAGATKAWDELLSRAKAAKELNRVNGMLINQRMARNQNALNILQGNRPGESFYGPNGQSALQSGSRKLVVG